jgi:hypothetical protein
MKYATEKVDFSDPSQRFSSHRTFKKALEFSASSYSYQVVRAGNTYEWDNIAPEIAHVILEEALLQGIDIGKDVISEEKFDESVVLKNILSIINNDPNYALFAEKLAFAISKGQAAQLTYSLLNQFGINNLSAFQKIYIQELVKNEQLTKNFPKFEKIPVNTEFKEIVEYLVSDPLLDKFLKDFTNRLAYSRGKQLGISIDLPASFTKDSLLNFFKKIKLNSTEDLIKEGLDFINQYNHDLFLAYLPSTDLVQDEWSKYVIYRWLQLGNMDRFKEIIASGAVSRYVQKIETAKINYQLAVREENNKNPFFNLSEETTHYNELLDSTVKIVSKITAAISNLESDKHANNPVIDQHLHLLEENLTTIKEYASSHNLSQKALRSFIKEILFNTAGKAKRYISERQLGISENTSLLKLDIP